MGKKFKRLLLIISIFSAFVLMSGGYGYWSKTLTIITDITVKEPVKGESDKEKNLVNMIQKDDDVTKEAEYTGKEIIDNQNATKEDESIQNPSKESISENKDSDVENKQSSQNNTDVTIEENEKSRENTDTESNNDTEDNSEATEQSSENN